MKYKDEKIKSRLHKKTRELLLTKGVKGWNMNTLATESGIAKSTLYRMINSKEELIRDVIVEDMRAIEYKINDILTSNDNDDIINKISKTITEYVPMMFGSYLNEALLEYPTLEEQVQKREQNIRHSIMLFIELGQKKDQIKDGVDGITVFETLLGIVLQFVKLGYGGNELSKKIYQSFQYVFEGIRIQ